MMRGRLRGGRVSIGSKCWGGVTIGVGIGGRAVTGGLKSYWGQAGEVK